LQLWRRFPRSPPETPLLAAATAIHPRFAEALRPFNALILFGNTAI